MSPRRWTKRNHSEHILYINFDGVLQPLGYSQVLRVVTALARRGFKYTLLTLERPADLDHRQRVTRVANELSDAGVDWVRHVYATAGGAADALRNLVTAGRAALDIVRHRSTALIHARSYHAAAVARSVHFLTGTKYLFDIRGYWIDERLDERRWFTHPAAYRTAKALERNLYQNTAAVVSLTQLAADDILKGEFGPWDPCRPVVVIPTCVDYDDFTISRQDTTPVVHEEVRRVLESSLTVAFIGAINAAYLVDESVTLFKYLTKLRDDTHLLCLTRQVDEMKRILQQHRIADRLCTVTSVPHREIPAWLSLADWGLLLRIPTFANRATMPTKLAEFFAAGVRPVQYGCNEEVAGWVQRAGSGYVLESTAPHELKKAAAYIAGSPADLLRLEEARTRTAAHFSLKPGIDRYERLLNQLLARN